ncbi:MAG: hypothetical protein WDZ41_05675 [Candidatus Babeliales bacterium]
MKFLYSLIITIVFAFFLPIQAMHIITGYDEEVSFDKNLVKSNKILSDMAEKYKNETIEMPEIDSPQKLDIFASLLEKQKAFNEADERKKQLLKDNFIEKLQKIKLNKNTTQKLKNFGSFKTDHLFYKNQNEFDYAEEYYTPENMTYLKNVANEFQLNDVQNILEQMILIQGENNNNFILHTKYALQSKTLCNMMQSPQPIYVPNINTDRWQYFLFLVMFQAYIKGIENNAEKSEQLIQLKTTFIKSYAQMPTDEQETIRNIANYMDLEKITELISENVFLIASDDTKLACSKNLVMQSKTIQDMLFDNQTDAVIYLDLSGVLVRRLINLLELEYKFNNSQDLKSFYINKINTNNIDYSMQELKSMSYLAEYFNLPSVQDIIFRVLVNKIKNGENNLAQYELSPGLYQKIMKNREKHDIKSDQTWTDYRGYGVSDSSYTVSCGPNGISYAFSSKKNMIEVFSENLWQMFKSGQYGSKRHSMIHNLRSCRSLKFFNDDYLAATGNNGDYKTLYLFNSKNNVKCHQFLVGVPISDYTYLAHLHDKNGQSVIILTEKTISFWGFNDTRIDGKKLYEIPLPDDIGSSRGVVLSKDGQFLAIYKGQNILLYQNKDGKYQYYKTCSIEKYSFVSIAIGTKNKCVIGITPKNELICWDFDADALIRKTFKQDKTLQRNICFFPIEKILFNEDESEIIIKGKKHIQTANTEGFSGAKVEYFFNYEAFDIVPNGIVVGVRPVYNPTQPWERPTYNNLLSIETPLSVTIERRTNNNNNVHNSNNIVAACNNNEKEESGKRKIEETKPKITKKTPGPIQNKEELGVFVTDENELPIKRLKN